MKPILLKTADGADLGFVLCAIPPGDREGDCIFSIVPDRAELLEDAAAQELLARKDQGESMIEVSSDGRSAVIRTDEREDLYVELDAEGRGCWGLIRDGEKIAAGQAALIARP